MGKASGKKKQKSADLKNTIPGPPLETRGNPQAPGAGRHAVLLALIILACLLAYSNTFNAPFLFDDYLSIGSNPVVSNLDNFLTSTRGYDHNPNRFIGYLSFALNYHAGGMDTTGYHVVNIAIHILNSILVYVLVLLIFKTPLMQRSPETSPQPWMSSWPVFIALFSSLLFAVHPLQTQAVTYIVQRFASLAAFFYLGSVVMYIQGRLAIEGPGGRVRGIVFFLASFLATVLAMKTKEVAFTLPLALVLCEGIFFKAGLGRRLLYLTPFLLTLLIIPLSIMSINQPLGEILSDVSEQTRLQTQMNRWDYFVTQMRVITTYIRLLFMPVNQNVDYDYPVYHSLFTLPVFFSFLFLLSLLGTAVYLLHWSGRNDGPAGSPFSRYARLIAFGVFWFFLTLAVESSIIPIVDVIFEHRVYLPSAGLIIAFTTSLFVIFGRMVPERKAFHAVIVLLALLVAVLFGAAYARNEVWKSGITLFEDVVEESPNKARAHHNLGVVYLNAGRNDNAIEAFSRAVALNPNYAMAFLNLGAAYANKGDLDKAIESLLKAISLRPKFGEAYNYLGMAYAKKGLSQQAIEAFSTAVVHNPNLVIAYYNRGIAYTEKGELDKALRDFSTAIEMKSNYARAYNNRGRVHLLKGDRTHAIEDFQRSCSYGNKEGCELLQSLLRK